MTFRSSHSGGVNVLLHDGSVRSTDTSAVATLMDFDFPSQDGLGDTIWIDMGAPPADPAQIFARLTAVSGNEILPPMESIHPFEVLI